ncbi:hypothetical protein Z948_1787 [Sulfitobacter donghicola DSW-25 = KCTC 12864 = JCM 14565]|nr:hypothetical protein Z948_1787 [Sulfitobacter donghicola DSW-25 = KCTC 12864 = JCM 14565]
MNNVGASTPGTVRLEGRFLVAKKAQQAWGLADATRQPLSG